MGRELRLVVWMGFVLSLVGLAGVVAALVLTVRRHAPRGATTTVYIIERETVTVTQPRCRGGASSVGPVILKNGKPVKPSPKPHVTRYPKGCAP